MKKEITTKHFLVVYGQMDGEHDHTARGIMRGKSEKDVMNRAHERGVARFAFEDHHEDCISVFDIREILEADAQAVLRVGAVPDLDERTDHEEEDN